LSNCEEFCDFSMSLMHELFHFSGYYRSQRMLFPFRNAFKSKAPNVKMVVLGKGYRIVKSGLDSHHLFIIEGLGGNQSRNVIFSNTNDS
jgi:hypothetical protein